MTRGRWSLKAWTSAHVYLGLSLVVIATLHTGFQFGWNVHTLAYALMMLVILSGIYGIAVYATLPSELSNSRSEMTRPQMIDAVMKLDRQLQIAAQPLDHEDARIVSLARRRSVRRRSLSAPVRSLPPLPHGAGAGGDAPPPSGSRHRRAARGARQRRRPARAQGRRAGPDPQHLRIKALLEVWLYVHVPLTFALIAALAAHIVSVFFYW
jgi:hypothetical protein